MSLSDTWGDTEYGYPLLKEIQIEGEFILRIYSTQKYLLDRAGYIKHIWMLEKNNPVGYMKIFDNSNRTYPNKTVICNVEISPQHRGMKLSRKMYETVAKEYGPLWRTGMMTLAVEKVTRDLNINIIDSSQKSLKDGHYSFVNWGDNVNIK